MEITNFGAIQSPISHQDVLLGSVQVPTPYPSVYLPNYTALAPFYQNGIPGCGGAMGGGAKAASIYNILGITDELSWRFVYALAKTIDGFPNEDGTTMRAVFTVLKNFGVPKASLLPNDILLSVPDFRDITRISPECYADAATRKIASYAFLTSITMDSIKAAIYQNEVVAILKRPWIPGKYLDGHFIFLDGFDETRLRYRNSLDVNKDPNAEYWFTKDDVPTFIEAGTFLDIHPDLIKELTNRRDLLTKVRDLEVQLLDLQTQAANNKGQ